MKNGFQNGAQKDFFVDKTNRKVINSQNDENADPNLNALGENLDSSLQLNGSAAIAKIEVEGDDGNNTPNVSDAQEVPIRESTQGVVFDDIMVNPNSGSRSSPDTDAAHSLLLSKRDDVVDGAEFINDFGESREIISHLLREQSSEREVRFGDDDVDIPIYEFGKNGENKPKKGRSNEESKGDKKSKKHKGKNSKHHKPLNDKQNKSDSYTSSSQLDEDILLNKPKGLNGFLDNLATIVQARAKKIQEQENCDNSANHILEYSDIALLKYFKLDEYLEYKVTRLSSKEVDITSRDIKDEKLREQVNSMKKKLAKNEVGQRTGLLLKIHKILEEQEGSIHRELLNKYGKDYLDDKFERLKVLKDNQSNINQKVTPSVAVFINKIVGKLLIGINGNSNEEFVKKALDTISALIETEKLGELQNLIDSGSDEAINEIIKGGTSESSSSLVKKSGNSGKGSTTSHGRSFNEGSLGGSNRSNISRKLTNVSNVSGGRFDTFVDTLKKNKELLNYLKNDNYEILKGKADADTHAEMNVIDDYIQKYINKQPEDAVDFGESASLLKDSGSRGSGSNNNWYIGNNKPPCLGCGTSIKLLPHIFGSCSGLNFETRADRDADLNGIFDFREGKEGSFIYSPAQFIKNSDGVDYTPLLKARLTKGYFKAVSGVKNEKVKDAAADYWYSEDDINTLLRDPTINTSGAELIAQTQFENTALLVSNIYAAMQTALNGEVAMMPINVNGNHWVSALFRLGDNGNVQIIYIDPLGNNLELYPNAALFITAITEIDANAQFLDLSITQQSNDYDCGRFIVHNLAQLARATNSQINALFVENANGNTAGGSFMEAIRGIGLLLEEGRFPEACRILYKSILGHDHGELGDTGYEVKNRELEKKSAVDDQALMQKFIKELGAIQSEGFEIDGNVYHSVSEYVEFISLCQSFDSTAFELKKEDAQIDGPLDWGWL